MGVTTFWWVCILGGALLSGGLWLFWRRQRGRSSEAVQPVASRRKAPRYEVIVTKEKTAVPPVGYSRRSEPGVFPISQLVAVALEGLPGSHGLYSVTFTPETLTALRSGDATLMHSLKGDRAVAVRLNGRVKELGTVTGPSFDVGRACLATASIVTGQYFLARIDQKLNAILAGVQDILEILDSSERAELNSAKGYLRALLTVRQGMCTENDVSDLRNYRMKCVTIATRNLDVIEKELTHPQPRRVLGPKEFAGAKREKLAGWVSNQVSRWIPSRREEKLIADTREFAKTMTRGLLALQAILCFEAILEQEPTSPNAWQACSMVQPYGAAREKFQAQLRERKEVALADFRYFNADEKRERLRQELQALISPVDMHWETLKEMEDQWRLRLRCVPEVLYVSVNEVGQPLEVFLPTRSSC